MNARTACSLRGTMFAHGGRHSRVAPSRIWPIFSENSIFSNFLRKSSIFSNFLRKSSIFSIFLRKQKFSGKSDSSLLKPRTFALSTLLYEHAKSAFWLALVTPCVLNSRTNQISIGMSQPLTSLTMSKSLVFTSALAN